MDMATTLLKGNMHYLFGLLLTQMFVHFKVPMEVGKKRTKKDIFDIKHRMSVTFWTRNQEQRAII